VKILKIALDCDGVLSDFTSGALRVIDEVTGRKYTAADIKEFNFAKALGLSKQETSAVMKMISSRRGFAASLPPYPLARQGVRRLRELGEVYCVTSPWDTNPWWREERTVWLALHFGIDVVHHAVDKSVYAADIFVDDRSDHVCAWLAARPGRTAVLWRTLHNTSEAIPCGAHSTGSWEELYQIARATVMGPILMESTAGNGDELSGVKRDAVAALKACLSRQCRIEGAPVESADDSFVSDGGSP
jgi:5'(3')-deoxyribonucleotidase